MRNKITLKCGEMKHELWFYFEFDNFLVYEHKFLPIYFVIDQDEWAATLCEINLVKISNSYRPDFTPYDVNIVLLNNKFGSYSLLDETTFPIEQIKRIFLLRDHFRYF